MHVLGFFLFPIFGFGFVFYFLPATIAWCAVNEKLSILVLNFFLGWTLIGWIVRWFWRASRTVWFRCRSP